MEMSDAEIKRKYERADGRKERMQQISILAELNGCSRYDIAKIIYDAGDSDITDVDLERFKKKVEKDIRGVVEAGAAKKKPTPTLTIQYKPKKQTIEVKPVEKQVLPQSVVETTFSKLEELDRDMRKILKKQRKLAEEMEQIEVQYFQICGFIGIYPEGKRNDTY